MLSLSDSAPIQIAFPAKAGIHHAADRVVDQRIPAFTGNANRKVIRLPTAATGRGRFSDVGLISKKRNPISPNRISLWARNANREARGLPAYVKLPQVTRRAGVRDTPRRPPCSCRR